MQFPSWICGLLWLGFPALMAYALPVINQPNLKTVQSSSQWEHYWIQYIIGLMSITATAFTIAGCLCCHKRRQRKGFQDKAEKYKQEFKDQNSIGHETTFSHSIDDFGFDMPCTQSVDRIQFEPLPVEQIICRNKNANLKRLPLSMFLYEEPDSETNGIQELYREWFDATNLHVSRERLKYLREIGHGWFGKVVEGHADLDEPKRVARNGSVIVRILTEEATMKEKAWFLGEATVYLKLQHPNILALLGCCLETDPYLLLFELCAGGDVKGFLLSNQDKKSQDALIKENIPIRMAIDITAGLKYMHTHGFVHTDLSARNCLVTSDLSVKVGDYGTAVEKYPTDYYVLSDRALPIRWSAPESIECTDVTVETREITAQANIWSYGVLLWEIFMWGKRPYDDKTDEQVMQMLLSLRANALPNGTQNLPAEIEFCPVDINKLIQLCMHLNPKDRPNFDETKQILLNEHMGYGGFDQVAQIAEVPSRQHIIKSASLQDLRGSIDSDFWAAIVEDNQQQTLQSSFRLGPSEPVKNIPKSMNICVHQESGSETEEESWKGRIEQGVYTEKVKQKSKSVTDLMVLVHIDFDSDAEVSMGTQIPDKLQKKRMSSTGSDSDLRHNIQADEFNEALRKLRDPLPKNTRNKIKSLESSEQPKFLTLVSDQAQMPILRLSLDEKQVLTNPSTNNTCTESVNQESASNKKHVLRLLTKGDPDLPLLRYVPDPPFETAERDNDFHISNAFGNVNLTSAPVQVNASSIRLSQSELKNDVLWDEKLEVPSSKALISLPDNGGPNDCSEPEANIPLSNMHKSCTEYLGYIRDNDFSNFENLCAQRKCSEIEEEELEEEEEERKHLSTPDDEQSSDSGFRDKESCEEEESVCPSSVPAPSKTVPATPTSGHNEDEQLQILLELDNILDAEYNSTLLESKELALDTTFPDNTEDFDAEKTNHQPYEIVISKSENRSPDLNENYCTKASIEDEKKSFCFTSVDDNSLCEMRNHDSNLDNIQTTDLHETPLQLESNGETNKSIQTNENETNPNDDDDEVVQDREQEHEDEDSSTMSLRSDNSYMSFGIDEEFVNAIRNELREKLPCAQMPVVEPLEDHDEDDPPVPSEIDVKQWEEDENEESCNQVSGGVGISIRYNVYGTPLSPILEERESTVNSESLISRDVSLASKDSVTSDDVLLVDTKTNKVILLEGVGHSLQEDDRDTTNEEFSEEENMDYTCSLTNSYNDKSRIIIPSGGAPLPSPEDESKWQQLSNPYPLPLPVPLQDDLISTSFITRNLWRGRDEGEDEDDVGDDDLDEDNSSSSGEFVWKRYDDSLITQEHIRNSLNSEGTTITTDNTSNEMDAEEEDGEQEQDDIDEEEEFTPSAWDATLAPHRSALRSPDKTLKSGDQKKSVCFKKQRYHCVYEYPKEVLVSESQAATSSEPTSYTDWEQMLEEPRLELFPLDYDDANCSGSEEFFVSSSNRPFQFTPSEAKYVSQFFPGATSTSAAESHDTVDSSNQDVQENNVELTTDYGHSQQYQLGELRHTRDRLKLNLFSRNGTVAISETPAKETEEDNMSELHDNDEPQDNLDFAQGQLTTSNTSIGDVPPNVPRKEIEKTANLN